MYSFLPSECKPSMNGPGDRDRFAIVGTTGSGKTYAGMYNLSHRNYDVKPWIIYDFKNDELINEIPGAQHISLTEKLPTRPGVYIVHPVPGEEELVDEHMMQIWAQENTGVYIDEGYMIPKNSRGFTSILTQGRSKHIPVITLSQRPVYMNRFVFTEAQYLQIFRLQHADDIATTQKFIPHDLSGRLPMYHSYWYDVANDKLVAVGPVPDSDAILDTFDTRMPRMRKVI